MLFPHPSSIHALPVELLTRVFVIGADDHCPYNSSPFLLKPDQNYYALPSTHFQLTASHVCQHWRHVALRTPSLWTTLCFRELCHIPRAAAYLARCASNPNRRLDILVDTVAPHDHVPGVTIYLDELRSIFSLIMPHVALWRAFHLKIRDNDCKLMARHNLGGSGPAPSLETLQLYHFEDFRAPRDLYIATYRPPVRIFSNSLPKLRNVSLIGVNLPWEQSPYLLNLHTLELALHRDSIRPQYKYWDRMLRRSPSLRRLFLTYSGPRGEDGTEDLAWTSLEDNDKGKGKGKEDDPIVLNSLWELSLTDLDPDYLCLVLTRLVMPSVEKLSLDLPDQDFTSFVELIAHSPIPVDPSPPPVAVTHSPTIFHHPHLNLDESSHSDFHTSHNSSPVDSYSSSSSYSWSSSSNTSSPVTSISSSLLYSPLQQQHVHVHHQLSKSLSASADADTPTPASVSVLPPTSSSTATTVITPLTTSPSSTTTTTTTHPHPHSPTHHPTTTTSSTTTTTTTLSPVSPSGLAVPAGLFKSTQPTPLPKLATTLRTLIITALECDWTSWRGLMRCLVAVEVVEVNFGRVTVTGAASVDEVEGGSKGAKEEAWSVLVEKVVVQEQERWVLPRMRRCKVAGVSGCVVREVIVQRESGGGGVEWLVVEDGYVKEDPEMGGIFDKGVWVDGGEGEDERERGRWVRVQRVVEEEDEDNEEEDGEEEGESEEGEGEEEGEEVGEEEEDQEIGSDNEAEMSESDTGTGANEAAEPPQPAESSSFSGSVPAEVPYWHQQQQQQQQQYYQHQGYQLASSSGATSNNKINNVPVASPSDSGTAVWSSSRRVDIHRGMA